MKKALRIAVAPRNEPSIHFGTDGGQLCGKHPLCTDNLFRKPFPPESKNRN